MSVDTVIYSITKLRLRFQASPESFSPTGQSKVLAVLDCMRSSLMGGYFADFDRYVDGLLGREPDLADFVLEELFEHLNIQDRDQLTALLAAE